jgi:hypothetical protein
VGDVAAGVSAPDVLWPPGTVVHPDGTIDSQSCPTCGVQTLSIVEYDFGGDVYAACFLCRDCQAKEARAVAVLRAIFDSYLAEGMSNETANDAMTRWHVRRLA